MAKELAQFGADQAEAFAEIMAQTMRQTRKSQYTAVENAVRRQVQNDECENVGNVAARHAKKGKRTATGSQTARKRRCVTLFLVDIGNEYVQDRLVADAEALFGWVQKEIQW